jgi:RNA polymerase sigma-70 factor, ECF subfamily
MGAGIDDDLALARACAEGDSAALRRFEDEVLGPAVGAVRSIDGSPAFVDEVRQRLRERLLVGDGTPYIRQYEGRGPLRGWVGVAAVRTALMMKRSTQRKREVSDDDWAGALSLATTGTPELDLLKRQHAAAFAEALRDAALALEPRLRAVLAMHFAEDLSIDEIGATYAVHRATAARWIQRARELLFEGTRSRLVERLKLTPTEVDRMAALVQSQVDVSLSQLLAEPS